MARRAAWTRALPFVAVAIAVIGWRFVGPDVREAAGVESGIPPRPAIAPPMAGSNLESDPVGRADAGTASPTTGIRLVTWNLRNFGARNQEHDLGRLQDRLDELDADVIAVQEIVRPDALRALRPQWELAVSKRGGRGGQHLGLWFDPKRVRVDNARDHNRISLGGSVRPAFSARVRSVTDPRVETHVVVVHLKARPEGLEARHKQWPQLASIVSDLGENVVVVGDFNVTGGEGRDASLELANLEKNLAAVQLERVPVEGRCSAYWQGRTRDAWLEPSLLDLVWVRGITTLGPAHPGAHCGSHTCQSFRSTRAYPDLDYRTISDHCPVLVDLSWVPAVQKAG